MKVRIVASHFNHPDFVELQYLSIQKYVKDPEVEFIVINDSLDFAHIRNWNDPNMTKKIEDMCKKYNIWCIRYPQSLHGGNRNTLFPKTSSWIPSTVNIVNTRCADVCQYGYNNLGKNFDGIYVIVDGDMFFSREISFNETMENYDIMAVQQSRQGKINYFWNGILVFNIPTLPNPNLINLDSGRVKYSIEETNEEGEIISKDVSVAVDTGGQTYWYMKKTPEAKIKFIHKTNFLWDYGSGSNWWHEPRDSIGFQGKDKGLKKFMEDHNFKFKFSK